VQSHVFRDRWDPIWHINKIFWGKYFVMQIASMEGRVPLLSRIVYVNFAAEAILQILLLIMLRFSNNEQIFALKKQLIVSSCVS
jgi:hypothetical protein